MVVLVTCKNEEDPIKNKGTRVLTGFSPLLVYGNFFKRSRTANFAFRGRIGPNFELVQDFMVVLLTSKNEDDLIKYEGARVLTRLYVVFSDTHGANSVVSGGIMPKFKLIQAFIVLLVTRKNEEDPIKNESTRVLTGFSPL